MISLGDKKRVGLGKKVAFMCSIEYGDLEPASLPSVERGNVLVVGCYDGQYEVLYHVSMLKEFVELYNRVQNRELIHLNVYQLLSSHLPKR